MGLFGFGKKKNAAKPDRQGLDERTAERERRAKAGDAEAQAEMARHCALVSIGLEEGKPDIGTAIYWFRQAEGNARPAMPSSMGYAANWIATFYADEERMKRAKKKSSRWWRDFKYEDLHQALYWFSIAKEYDSDNVIKPSADHVLEALAYWEEYYKKKKTARPVLPEPPARPARRTTEEILAELKSRAKAGDAEAQAELSEVYAVGMINYTEIKPDLEAAIYWFNQAENNETAAGPQLAIAAYMIAGQYVLAETILKSTHWWYDFKEEDLRQGLYWYSKAGEHGLDVKLQVNPISVALEELEQFKAEKTRKAQGRKIAGERRASVEALEEKLRAMDKLAAERSVRYCAILSVCRGYGDGYVSLSEDAQSELVQRDSQCFYALLEQLGGDGQIRLETPPAFNKDETEYLLAAAEAALREGEPQRAEGLCEQALEQEEGIVLYNLAGEIGKALTKPFYYNENLVTDWEAAVYYLKSAQHGDYRGCVEMLKCFPGTNMELDETRTDRAAGTLKKLGAYLLEQRDHVTPIEMLHWAQWFETDIVKARRMGVRAVLDMARFCGADDTKTLETVYEGFDVEDSELPQPPSPEAEAAYQQAYALEMVGRDYKNCVRLYRQAGEEGHVLAAWRLAELSRWSIDAPSLIPINSYEHGDWNDMVWPIRSNRIMSALALRGEYYALRELSDGLGKAVIKEYRSYIKQDPENRYYRDLQLEIYNSPLEERVRLYKKWEDELKKAGVNHLDIWRSIEEERARRYKEAREEARREAEYLRDEIMSDMLDAGLDPKAAAAVASFPYIIFDGRNRPWKINNLYGNYAEYSDGVNKFVKIYASDIIGKSASTSTGYFYWY